MCGCSGISVGPHSAYSGATMFVDHLLHPSRLHSIGLLAMGIVLAAWGLLLTLSSLSLQGNLIRPIGTPYATVQAPRPIVPAPGEQLTAQPIYAQQ